MDDIFYMQTYWYKVDQIESIKKQILENIQDQEQKKLLEDEWKNILEDNKIPSSKFLEKYLRDTVLEDSVKNKLLNDVRRLV